MTGHVGTAEGTAGGKGDVFKTRCGRIRSGVGGDMHGGGTGSSEETEDKCTGMHGVVSGLINV